MDLSAVGHIIIYGKSFSGKTFYAKHLLSVIKPIKTFIFAGVVKQWSEYPRVYDEKAQIKKVVIKAGKAFQNYPINTTPFALVLDDFNEQLNTSKDNDYNMLFTQGRHKGLRIINLSHECNGIGPTARGNVRYIIIMSSTPEGQIERIATTWFRGRTAYLKNKVREAYKENKYSAVWIDLETEILQIDVAPEIKKEKQIVVKTPRITPQFQEIQEFNGFENQEENPELINPHIPAIPTAVNSNMTIGSKAATNMVDNSSNSFNIDYKVSAQQKVEINQINNRLKIQNIKVDARIKLVQTVHETRDLIDRPYKAPEDISKIVWTYNRVLRPSIPFTAVDWHEGTQAFLSHCFKEHTTRKRRDMDIFTEAAGSMLLAQGNPVALMSSLANMGALLGKK